MSCAKDYFFFKISLTSSTNFFSNLLFNSWIWLVVWLQKVLKTWYSYGVFFFLYQIHVWRFLLISLRISEVKKINFWPSLHKISGTRLFSMQNLSFYIRITHINVIRNKLFSIGISKSFGVYFVIDIYLLLVSRLFSRKT